MNPSRLSHRARTALATPAASALVALAGCASPQVSDYAAEQPALDLRQYFDGPITAHGLVTDRSGKAVRRFTVQMQCSWVGNVGTLDETFTYSDGTHQRRVWRLVKQAESRYTGTADDVVGEATGQTAGNAFNWRYTLSLPVDGRVWDVQFDDWMFLMDGRTLLNRAAMSKFGIRVGEVTVTFYKP